MKLEFKPLPPAKKHLVFVRIDDNLLDQLETLQKQHKVDRSAVIRSLLEVALQAIK